MNFERLIAPGSVAPSLRASSKKQLFHELANRVADAEGLEARAVFDALMERERLGATAMGRGVAIPHARMAEVSEIRGYFARLERAVDFDAPDGVPVDLVFVLLAPEDAGADHLRALAKVSRLLRDEVRCSKLRSTADASAIFAILADEATSSRAA